MVLKSEYEQVFPTPYDVPGVDWEMLIERGKTFTLPPHNVVNMYGNKTDIPCKGVTPHDIEIGLTFQDGTWQVLAGCENALCSEEFILHRRFAEDSSAAHPWIAGQEYYDWVRELLEW